MTDSDIRYAIVFDGSEQRTDDGELMTREGEKFIVGRDEDGWVEATGFHMRKPNYERLPVDIKLFDSKEECDEFMKSWEGHPWWAIPNGKYEIIEVRPVIVQHISHYTKVK